MNVDRRFLLLRITRSNHVMRSQCYVTIFEFEICFRSFCNISVQMLQLLAKQHLSCPYVLLMKK
jgi:hypothetical protein